MPTARELTYANLIGRHEMLIASSATRGARDRAILAEVRSRLAAARAGGPFTEDDHIVERETTRGVGEALDVIAEREDAGESANNAWQDRVQESLVRRHDQLLIAQQPARSLTRQERAGAVLAFALGYFRSAVQNPESTDTDLAAILRGAVEALERIRDREDAL